MGEIAKIKHKPSNKIIIYLELSQKEAQKLKGHSKKIHLFAGDLCTHSSKIIERGAKKSAKYATIPLILRERKHPRLSEIQYQKLETNSKVFYITVAKKEKTSK